MRKLFLVFLPAFLFFYKQKTEYDTIIRHAMICDGSGNKPFTLTSELLLIPSRLSVILNADRQKVKLTRKDLRWRRVLLTLIVIMQVIYFSIVIFWLQ